MKARHYDKKVKIYQETAVSDGFAGTIPGPPTLEQTRWAKVEHPSQITAGQLRQDYGLDNQQEILVFCFRSFDFDKTGRYLTYRGSNYRPIVSQGSDQYSVDLKIIAIRQ